MAINLKLFKVSAWLLSLHWQGSCCYACEASLDRIPLRSFDLSKNQYNIRPISNYFPRPPASLEIESVGDSFLSLSPKIWNKHGIGMKATARKPVIKPAHSTSKFWTKRKRSGSEPTNIQRQPSQRHNTRDQIQQTQDPQPPSNYLISNTLPAYQTPG